MTDALITKFGQPSWRFASDTVEAYLTELGGHLGPISFRVGDRNVSPMSVAPWAEEPVAKEQIPLIEALRGDFFCLPFGGNGDAWNGETHPPHGETANSKWTLESIAKDGGETKLKAWLEPEVRKGRVEKELSVRDGQSVVYQRHTISGMSGPMPLGHHAMVKYTEGGTPGRVSTSAFTLGMNFPDAMEDPANGGYGALKLGAKFDSLESAELIGGGTTDLSVYPNRRGFEDVAFVVNAQNGKLGWAAATMPDEGVVWFSLKDPKVLRATNFWYSNRGRYYSPWNGRHANVIGIEDVTGFFHAGIAPSANPNILKEAGAETTIELSANSPTRVNYIIGVAAIGKAFNRVKEIEPIGNSAIKLTSDSGEFVETSVDLTFLEL